MRILDTNRTIHAGLSKGALVLLTLTALIVMPSVQAENQEINQPSVALAQTSADSASESKANSEIADSQVVSESNPAAGDTLAGKGAIQSQVKLSLLQEGESDHYSSWSLSPDGLKMVYISHRPQDIFIVSDLSTGVQRKYEEAPRRRSSTVWSPDGRRIAFVNNDDRHVSILTLASADVEKTDISTIPLDWSGDGRFLLGLGRNNGGIQLVDLETGETQVAVAAGTYDSTHHLRYGVYTGSPRLSPDGSCVAFSHSVDAGESDIFVQSIGSDERIRITSHKGRDWNPLWSPDGKNILFQGNRKLGRSDLLSVAIQDGKPVGEPRTLASNMGDGITLHSYSNSGRLLFVERTFEPQFVPHKSIQ